MGVSKHSGSLSEVLLSGGLKEVLDTKAMVAMIFFEVAGGPYGAEPVLRQGSLGVLSFRSWF